MDSPLEASLNELSDTQRKVVEWNDGALLVLAGPGSGKTRVLTCRIARLLDESPDERFRVLALTFTNKAAHEMESRVTTLASGVEERADIHTFHGFCARILRVHGIHLGIGSNFAIYSRTSDRQAVLEDALTRDPHNFDRDAHRLLPVIDALKARLIRPEQAESRVVERNDASPEMAGRIAHAYRLYEDELRNANALDFHSLILEAYELFGNPVFVQQYQMVYRYWLIDEFQDTNSAQYALLRRMAGKDFRQVFAVADDDQTIYEWNGASVGRIDALVKDFDCEVMQLPTNFRCPRRIVEVANRLVVYNVRRDVSKRPAESAQRSHSPDGRQIRCCVFETDKDEAAGIASEIARMDGAVRHRTLVLARTRSLLESMRDALQAKDVPATLLMRRDDFASPEMRWLVACLKQIDRPLDLRNMAVLVGAFGGFAPSPIELNDLVSRSEAGGTTCLSLWIGAARAAGLPSPAAEVVDTIADFAVGKERLEPTIRRALEHFGNNDPDDDLKDDLSAWRRLTQEIGTMLGQSSLEQFLQELELRSKEPVPEPGAVSLATIHGAKGLEYDTVYLIGMAEEILPSWHSVRKGNGSAGLEEERRSCFVAITRTKRHLILSRADSYKGWSRKPSRFLEEMGFLDRSCDDASHSGKQQ